MALFGDELTKALQATTRPIPATTYGRISFLLDQAGKEDRRRIRGTGQEPATRAELARRVAREIGVSQRTVERYRDKQITTARPEHAAAIENAVRTRWQPQVRAKAKKKAMTSEGIVINTRARLGYQAPVGTTDQDRIRDLTVALPPEHAARLFDAQDAGESDERLRDIAAEALKEVYFQDRGRRAGSLEKIQFNDIEDLNFGL